MDKPQPPADKRNTLRISRFAWFRSTGVSAAMVERARRRIADAGGTLAWWAVLREDIYETAFGDGLYLHLRAIALNPIDAERLAALPPEALGVRWHVKPYVLELRDGTPRLRDPWPVSEEFSINDVVAILAEIPLGGTASPLLVGSGAHGRKPGPNLLLLPQTAGRPPPV